MGDTVFPLSIVEEGQVQGGVGESQMQLIQILYNKHEKYERCEKKVAWNARDPLSTVHIVWLLTGSMLVATKPLIARCS